jgi:Phage integrase family
MLHFCHVCRNRTDCGCRRRSARRSRPSASSWAIGPSPSSARAAGPSLSPRAPHRPRTCSRQQTGRRADLHLPATAAVSTGMGRLVSSAASHAGWCAGWCAVKPIGPHTLRHAFIPAALDAGVPLRDVQEAGSHADPRTAMRYDRPGLSRPSRHLHRIHLHRKRRPADLTFWAPAQARWRPESGTGRHADRRLGGGCLRIGRTADSLEIGRYVAGGSCGWPLYPVGMPFVYHLCADDFRGTTLYPLHRLRDKHPVYRSKMSRPV